MRCAKRYPTAGRVELIRGYSPSDGCRKTALAESLIPPQQAHEPALDLDPVGPEDAGFISLVGRFEGDRGAAAAQPLQRHFDVVDQRHHDRAVIGGIAALDDDRVAVEDAGVDHAVAGNFE